jgi:hypothetical protein
MTDIGSGVCICSCGIYYISHCICFTFTFLKEEYERRRLEPVLIQDKRTSFGNYIAVQDILENFTLTENN